MGLIVASLVVCWFLASTDLPPQDRLAKEVGGHFSGRSSDGWSGGKNDVFSGENLMLPESESDERRRSVRDSGNAAAVSVATQISKAEYWFTPMCGEFHGQLQAPNKAHGLMVRMGEAGLQVSPIAMSRGSRGNWKFALGVSEEVQPVWERSEVSYPQGGGQREWFVNSKRGIEHGMYLEQAVSDTTKPMKFVTDWKSLCGRRLCCRWEGSLRREFRRGYLLQWAQRHRCGPRG